MDTIFIILFLLNILFGILNTYTGVESSSSFRVWIGAFNWLAAGSLTENVIRAFQ